MEFPTPTIDAAAELSILLKMADLETLGIAAEPTIHLQSLLAQAWEEGRWSPPGACMNPYGEPAAPLAINGAEGYVGLRLLHLRQAAQAALAWLENMTSTKSRDALKEQLRNALGGK